MKKKKKFYDWDVVLFILVGLASIAFGGYFLYAHIAEGAISNKTFGCIVAIGFGCIVTFVKVRELFGKY